MTTALLIYLYVTLTSLVKVGIFATTTIGTLALFIVAISSDSLSEFKEHSKTFRLSLILYIWIALATIGVLIPSKEDLAWIVGGTAAITITSKDEAQKLPDNLLKAANIFLEGIQQEKKNEQ